MTDTLHVIPQATTGTRLHLRAWHFILRHPVLSVAIVAFAVRMLTAICLVMLGIDDLVSDDRAYRALVQSKLDGSLDSADQYSQDLYASTWVFLAPIVLVSRVFGNHVLVGQSVIVLWGALTAAITTMIALRTLSSRPLAVLAGLVPAVLPSQILWSSVWLKDAAVSTCLAAVVLGFVLTLRMSAPRSQLVGVAVMAAGLFGLSGLRINSFVIASWCLAIAVGLVHWRRPALLVAAMAMVIVVPWVGGAGLLGSDVFSRADSLGTQRAAGAVDADSALVRPSPLPGPSTAGSDAEDVDDIRSNLTHLPSGVLAVLFRPFPWDESTSETATFAKIDNLIWYAIAALAIMGLWTARRRADFAVTIVLTAATVGVYALAEGNLGTAYRHRGEIVWAAALLAALYLDNRRRRTHLVDDVVPASAQLAVKS